MFGKISVELFEARLSFDAVNQTLRAIVCQPWLDDVTIGDYKTVSHIKAGSNKLKLGYCCFPFGS